MAPARLRVAQLLPALNGGGVERGTVETSRALIDAGHESLVISAGGRLVQEIEADGGRHIKLDIGQKRPWVFARAWQLAQCLREVDVVDARSRLPAWVCLLALRLLPRRQRPRLVTSVHGLNSVSRYSAVLLRGERIVCVSQAVADYLREHYPQLDESRLRIIPRGIDASVFPPNYQPPTHWWDKLPALAPAAARAEYRLLLPGRLSRRKGHDAFLRLLAGLRDRGIDVAGMIVGNSNAGDAEYQRALQAQAEAVGVAQFLDFVPQQADIQNWMAASQAVLCLSNKPEAFGRTVLEPLSLGVPVYAWDWGGVSEMLEYCFPDGAVAPFDEQALLDAVVRGLKQRPEVRSDHPWQLAASNAATLAVYEELGGPARAETAV